VHGPLPFAIHATIGCPSHAELALSLAWTFRDVDAGAVDEALDALAGDVRDAASPEAELRALAPLAARLGGPPPARRAPGVDDLMIDTALAHASPHPLARAMVVAEAGRRRGYSVEVVSNGSDHCVGHTELGEPLILRASDAAIVDAHSLPPTLTWRCAHETCGLVMDALERRWLDEGCIDHALRVAKLRLHLPFGEDGMAVAVRRLRRVEARLN
jgi:hypothetical protein